MADCLFVLTGRDDRGSFKHFELFAAVGPIQMNSYAHSGSLLNVDAKKVEKAV